MPQTDLQHILSQFSIESLNEMQEATIAASEVHNDIILLSNTGTGKTLAFLISLWKQFDEPAFRTEAMIIVPTRELAVQIESVFKQMGTGFKVTVCYGGHKREIEENELIQAPKLIIGTPGRLADHIRRGSIRTDTIHSIVLDEFDKSLEFGYAEEIEFIVSSLPNITRRIYSSATRAVETPEFAQMADPKVLNFVKEEAYEWEKIIYQYTRSKEEEKAEDLLKLLCEIGNRSTVIFCNHKETVERISIFLKERGLHNVYYHGSLEQRDRDAAITRFKNGSASFLVTTDIASRGLDIPNIRFVIHYQMPHTGDIFNHRNGRTARMDASGTIICMLSGNETFRDYVDMEIGEKDIPQEYIIPDKPKWVTLYFPHGKKNKVNKVDIVGFLSQVGELSKEDIGLIEVKDFHSFAAIRRSKSGDTVYKIKNGRMKGKLAKAEVQK
ncbi:MAG: DEAD/DEAH box helicase [Taibaiella sp.]|nr:DEAD/DEAH box helicase [Taibaiella sp.]